MNKIFSEIWIKRWAGSYTFISSDYWGKQYFFSLEKELGVGFKHSFFTHRKGVVSFYLLKSEFENFGKKMAEVVVQDWPRAEKWLTALKENTDSITLAMNATSGRLPTKEEYATFLKYYDRHLPLHNFMKKTVDFLPQKEGERLLPFFKEARMYSEHVYSDTERFFRGIAAVIAERSGYATNALTCLTQDEFEKYLEAGVLPLESALAERYDASALSFEDGQQSLLLGVQVEEAEKQIEAAFAGEANFLKGTVAYPGVAKGKICVVLDPQIAGEFRDGDILVTGMTRPEFVPLIKRASGVITDAGGVLCHAAITARELKKPCVVGTQVATKILQTGNLVELDATKGTIKIINA
jgi:phosphohistidine swiveling domain-containing protein